MSLLDKNNVSLEISEILKEGPSFGLDAKAICVQSDYFNALECELLTVLSIEGICEKVWRVEEG